MKLSDYKLRLWSIAVRRRDKVCRMCGSMEKRQAHHIFDKSNHPDQAYDTKNGITLCGDNKKTGNACHRTFHAVFKGGHRRKCTLADWQRFERLVRWSMAIKKTEAVK